MKLRLLAPSLLCGLLMLVATGCKGGGGDGVNSQDAKQLTDISALAKQADGDFDKLPANGKQQALQMANGDEKQARSLVKLMAHPPNEGRTGPAGHAPGGAPPPAAAGK